MLLLLFHLLNILGFVLFRQSDMLEILVVGIHIWIQMMDSAKSL